MSQKKVQLLNPLSGNINVAGVITASSFVGSGEGLTGVASTDNIQTATEATFLSGVKITGVTTASGGVVGNLTGTASNATLAVNAQGLTGTPNITVGSVTAASGSFSGNVTIGGTLTYQDVEHIDSVGIITAQQGIQVLANGLTITGVSTFNDNIDLQDDDKILIGTGDDLEIYHDGTDNFIKSNNALKIQAAGSNSYTVHISARTDKETIKCYNNTNAPYVEFFYDNSKKLETSSSGITVTGTVAATSYTGDGSALTGISVGITTESITATDQSIATLNLSKDAHKVKVSGVATIDCQGGSEYGTHILTIENTGIATVGFSTYFLFPSGSEPSLPTTSGAISQLSFTVHRVGAAGTQVLTTAALNLQLRGIDKWQEFFLHRLSDRVPHLVLRLLMVV